MTNEHGTIEHRLEKLERQNRQMKLAGIGALVIAGAFLLMGQASGPRGIQDEVRARSFVVVDPNGETRAWLHVSSEASGLSLYDANGKSRAGLVVSSAGPGLALIDGNGEPRARLSVLSGGPTLALGDPSGKTRETLTVSPAGPALTLQDDSGKMRAALIVIRDGPYLGLQDAAGEPRALLSLSSEGPKLGLNDANGFDTEIGVTDLVTPATGETVKTSAASIALFGKDKKVLWSVPPQD